MSRLAFELLAGRGAFRLEVSARTEGPWIGVVGASGAGKSTFLEAVAGLLPSEGYIEVDGTILQDTASDVWLSPQARRTGYVFQGEALFPHLSVAANLAFGMEHPSEETSRHRFHEVASTLDLDALLERRSGGLSGGERRRVALGRALLRDPRLLLLDEPLTGLDPALRGRVLDYLSRVRSAFSHPALLVSHRLEDVLALTDHVLVFEHGRVAASGPPLQLLHGPQRSALENLIGFENVFEVLVDAVDADAGTVTARSEEGASLQLPPAPLVPGMRVRVGLRAEDVILATRKPGPTSARNLMQGRVTALIPQGPWTSVHLDCGLPLVARITPASAVDLGIRPGAEVWTLFKTHSCHYLDADAVATQIVKDPGPLDVQGEYPDGSAL